MKLNGDRSPEDIQAEIQRTRSHMDATLSAIQSRLTPGQLMDEGIGYLRRSGGSEFVHNLGNQAKNNPMPVALMGIALAWLMASGRSSASNASASTTPWDTAGDMDQVDEIGRSVSGDDMAGDGMTGDGTPRASLKERVGSAKDRVLHATESMKDRIGNATSSLSSSARSARDRARDSVSGMAGSVTGMASSARDSARSTYYRARGGYESMMEEHPLALGAIGLAIGAVIAAALPRTRKEDELMGESSDRLAGQAKQIGREKLEQAKDVARTAVDSVKEEAQKQGMTGSASGTSTNSQGMKSDSQGMKTDSQGMSTASQGTSMPSQGRSMPSQPASTADTGASPQTPPRGAPTPWGPGDF